MLRVRLLAAARREVMAAAEYYKAEGGASLAADFRAELRRVVTFGRQFPQGGRVIAEVSGLELRHFVMQRFPYQVIGCAVGPELVVFAVTADKQHPDYWKPRLAKVRR